MAKGILSGLVWGAVGGTAVLSVLSLYAPLHDERPQPASAATPAEDDSPEVSELDEWLAAPETAVAGALPEERLVAPNVLSNAPERALTAAIEGEAHEGTATAEVKPSVPTFTPLSQVPLEQELQFTRPENPDDRATPVLNARAPDVPSALNVDESIAVPSVSVAKIDAGTDPVSTAPLAVAEPAPDVVPEADAPPVQPLVVAELEAPVPSSPPIFNETPTQEAAKPRIVFPSFDNGGSDAEAEIAADADTQSDTSVSTISSDTPITLQVPDTDNQATGVVVNRLPSLTAPQAEEEEATAEAEPVAVDIEGLGALRAFAADIDVTDGASMFGIVLVHAGEDGVGAAELADLDLPFSIAIDPSAPDAKEAAAIYRAAGIEVLAMLNDLPESSEPSDVAIAMEGYFGVLKEAVAVLDPLDARIQSNRDLLEPVLDAIAQTGHGLVTYDKGLNSAQKTAERQNIAVATVFRLLDGDLETTPKIKRYLSRAAFTAAQDGSVVVLGRAYPETVKALVEWALEDKVADMSVVPVSKIMLEDAS